MDKKFETGNTAHNTGHASRNPNPNTPEMNPVSRDSNPASNSPLESNPASRVSQPESRSPEMNPVSRVSQPADQFQDDEISLKELILKIQEWWRYLLSKWLIILIAGLLGGALGLFYSIYKKPTYTATLTFVLEDESAGGTGNLGGLAAMAGINMGAGGNGLFKGENIFEIYKSRSMLTKTLLSSTNENDSLLIDRYIAFNNLKEIWKEKPELEAISFSIPKEQFTLQHDSITGQIVNLIKENNLNVSKPDKKTSLIHVSTNSINESFSKDFTEILVRNVNSFYIETKTKKSLNNLNVLQHQADSVRNELNAAIGGVAIAMDANPNSNPARRVLNVPSSKRQVDVQANQAILTELVKNLEMARISLRKETPLIQVIDEPIFPLKKESFGKTKGIIIGGLICGFLVVLIFIVMKVFKKLIQEE